MSFNVGTAFIQISPSFKGMQTKIQAEVKTWKAIEIPVAFDTSGLGRQYEEERAKPRKPFTVPLEVDKGGKFETDLKARLKAAQAALGPLKIGASTSEADQKVKDLQARIVALSNKTIGVDISDADALAEVKRLSADLDKLGSKSPSVRVKTDTGAAVAELVKFQAELNRIDGQTAEVKVKADTAGARQGIGLLGLAIVGLAPVAVPALAVVTAGVGALGSALITAGAAGGIFGVAVGGQIAAMKTQQQAIKTTAKQVGAARTAQDGYKIALDATTKGTAAHASALKTYQSAVARTAEYQRRLNIQQANFHKQFGPAAKGLDLIKKSFHGFLRATSGTTNLVIGRTLTGIANVLPRLVPLANAAGHAVGRLVGDLIRGSKSKGFANLLGFFQKYGPAAIVSFGHIAGNILVGVFNLFKAFAPYQKAFLGGFERMTRSFAHWSAGFGKSNGFRKFMAYVKSVLPDVKALFGNLVTFIGKFIVALGPLGGVEIKIFTKLLEFLNKLPPPALTAIAASITAVVLATKGIAALNFLFVDNPLGLIIVAVGLLAAGFILAYKHSATFRKIVNGALNGVKDAAKAVVGWFTKSFVPFFTKTIPAAFHALAGAGGNVWGAISGAARAVVTWFIKSFLPFFTKTIPNAFRALVGVTKSAWGAVSGAISTAWNTVTRPVFKAFRGGMAQLGAAFKVIRGIVKYVWDDLSAIIRGEWNLIVKPVFIMFRDWLVKRLSDAFNFLKGIVTAVWGAVSGVISAAWNRGVLPVFRAVRDWLTKTLTDGFHVLSRVVSAVWGAIRDAISAAWNRGIVPVFKAVRDWLTKTLTDAFHLLQRIVGAVWGAIRDTISTVWNRGILPVFKAIRDFVLTNLSRDFYFLRDQVVIPVFHAVGKVIHDVWANVILPVFDKLKSALGSVQHAFRTAIDAIGRIWGELKKSAHDAIGFVVNTVYDAGIRPVVNAIPGVHDLPYVKFSEGGYTGAGGKYEPAGIVHRGEYVIPQEQTSKHLGLLQAIHHGVQGFSQGGLVGGGNNTLHRPVRGGVITQGLHDQWTGYPAIDFGVPVGTPVAAGAAGRVSVSRDLQGSYGRYIQILSQGFSTLYAHLSRRGVGVGSQVASGQIIGLSGNSGNSTGPHLHFGARGISPYAFTGASTSYSGHAGNAASGYSGPSLGSLLSLLNPGTWGDRLRGMGPFGGLMSQMVGGLVGKVKDFATGKIGALIKAAGSLVLNGGGIVGSTAGVGQWTGTVTQVLRALGISTSNTGAVLHRIGQESGGRVGAVNRTDSNARAGHPSTGLMQLIGGTYGAYKPHPDSGPYEYGVSVNPYANIYAGVNYASHDPKYRGRSLSSVMLQPGGYDKGGYLPPGLSTVFNGTRRPEPVFTDKQWGTLQQIGSGGGQASGPSVTYGTVQVTNVDELMRKQQAALHRAVVMASIPT